MANHKSEIKRARQAAERQQRNRATKTRVKKVVKTLRRNRTEKPKEEALKELQAAQSVIDKAAKKGAIHKRTAARKISRLAKGLNRPKA